MSPVDVRRAGTRPHTKIGWLDSWHSFSFGPHYDPANTHHGLLLVNNDDRVSPASGFPTHFHRDMEIVTWVLSGRLEHRDSEGNHGELYPGLAQRMSAGTGIEHSEMNPSPADHVHFVQMWVPPDREGIPPSYEQRDINAELDKGGLRPIASGQGHDGAIAIHQRDAVLWGTRLGRGGAPGCRAAPTCICWSRPGTSISRVRASSAPATLRACRARASSRSRRGRRVRRSSCG